MCPNCHKEEPRERIHCTPTYRWTSALAVCESCGHRAREVSHITQLYRESLNHFCSRPEHAPLVAFETHDGASVAQEHQHFYIYREGTQIE
jgi:hypothetical protein